MPNSPLLTIDTENPKKSYSLKGINEILLTNQYNYWGTPEANLEDMITNVAFSGKNMILTIANVQQSKLNFTNVTSLDDIVVKYMNGEELKINDAGVLTAVLNAKLASNPITEPQKGTNVTGSLLNDVMNLSAFPLWKDKDKTILQDDYTKKGLKIDGGNGNDSIIGSNYSDNILGGAGVDTLDGGNGNDTITAGGGNDTIIGGLGKDKLTGGTGKNTYKYNLASELNRDQIVLTKGENAIIDVHDIAGDVSYKVNGKDLDVTIGGNTLKILNFGAKDITNNSTKKDPVDTSSVILRTSEGDIDLREDLLTQTAIEKNYTGTFHRDNITAEDYINAKEKGLTISGGLGADSIVGSRYADVIKGGAGDDTIKGGEGNDNLYGEDGNNTFIFSAGSEHDTVNSGKGTDTLQFNGINEGDLTFSQGLNKNNKDLVISYNGGDDSVTVKNYFTVDKQGNITGVNAANSVKSLKTNTGVVDLASAVEYAYLYPNKNLIYTENNEATGTAGDDVIVGGDGDDTIHHSAGADVYIGGDGADTFEFAWGSGFADRKHSTIIMGDDGIQDIISFSGTAGNLGNMVFEKEGDNLRIWYNNDNTLDILSGKSIYEGSEVFKGGPLGHKFCSSIIVENYFTAENPTIDEIRTNGGAYSYSILNDSYNNSGFVNRADLDAESFDGRLDTYVDHVYTGTKYADYVDTRNGTGDGDTINTGAGRDYVYTWGRSETVHTGEGDDYIAGNKACLILDGGAGNDTISVRTSSGANPQGFVEIVGGTGNDSIEGYSGAKQVYEFNTGDGNDTVISTSNLDVLKFNDVAIDDLAIAISGDDIVITYGNSDTITLKNAHRDLVTIGIEDKNEATTTVLEELHIIKGSGAFSGTANSETIYGDTISDTITGCAGSDSIYGRAGDDVFVFNNGDGNDIVYSGVSGDTDTLKFADSELAELDFNNGEGDDLIISYNGGEDSVTVKDYFTAANTVTQWTDSNGDTYNLATVNRHNINSTDETINGTVFNDMITVNAENSVIDGKGGANTYLIPATGTFSIVSTSGLDTIKFTGVEIGDVIYDVSANDAIIKNGGETLRVTVKDYLVNMPALNLQGETGDPADLITQLADAGIIYSDEATILGNADSPDRIFGGDSANTIDGRGGDDILNGGKGNDVYKFAKGYVDATVINGTQENETDTLQFTDSTLDELDYSVSDNDLIITYNGGADSVTVKNYYTAGNTVKNLITRNSGDTADENHLMTDIRHVIQAETTNISGTALNDKIFGTDGDDTIHHSAGSDIYIGGDGADTYEFAWGSGFADRKHSTVVMGEDGVQDIISFTGTYGNFGNMAFEQEGDDLRIWYNYDNSLDIDYGKSIYQGSEVYRGGPFGYKFCSSVTVKDYFTAANPTIDDIRTNSGAYSYSILNESFRNVGFVNHADLDLESFDGRLDTYVDHVYTGTKYADYVDTRNGAGSGVDGDTIYTGLGRDYVYTWGRSEAVYTESGDDYIYGNERCTVLDGGTGNDEIEVHKVYNASANPQGYVDVYGGAGSDSITANNGINHIYTNSLTGGKDTTVGTLDTIVMNYNSNDGNMIYAQSQTNRITGGTGNDNYFAYIDQKTYIDERGGADDTLTLVNTTSTTDGAKANLHVLFNVSNDYTADQGIDAIGNIIVTGDTTKANYNAWKSNSIGGAYSGISIKNNAVETIVSSDNKTLTSADIAALGENVASWLAENTEFASVNALFESGTDDQITALVAQFDTANWQG